MRIPAIRKFYTLNGRDQKTLLKAFLLLSAVRLALWIIPFRTLQLTLKRFSRYSETTNDKLSKEKTAWAVRVASRHVPYATCLSQALTLQTIFARNGIHSDLVIGVTRGDDSRFKAHAWLEIDGNVIIGGQEPDYYTRLTNQE